MNKKRVLFFLSVAVFFLLATFSYAYVKADSEGSDGEDNYVQPQSSSSTTTPTQDSSSGSSSKKLKTVTQTVVVTPAKIVTETQIQTVSLPDRDHDGIPDAEDPHPDIAEIYIVKDDNLNGIVDTFEYGQ